MDDQVTRGQVVRLAVLFEGGMAVVACIVGWFMNYPPWEAIVWDAAGVGLGLAASGPMLVFFALCLTWPVGPLKSIKRFSDDVITHLFAGCTILDLAVISLLAGFGEEMLFRGVIQAALTDWLGLWPGIVLASLLFGLFHPFTPFYVVLAAMVGLYLGTAWLWTENLLVPIVAHGVYDFVALVILARSSSPPG
jgi:membrane protease YdiL (CAAX protease family)